MKIILKKLKKPIIEINCPPNSEIKVIKVAYFL